MTKKSSFLRKVCALAFASLLAQCVWAATPVAMWTDFNNLTSGGYTWTNNGGTVDEDGSLTIGKTDDNNVGLVMNLSSGNVIYANKTMTLIIDAEIPAVSADDVQTLIMNIVQNGSNVSVAANTDGKLYQRWGTGGSYGSVAYTVGERHLYALRYKGVSNAEGKGTYTFVDGKNVMAADGLMTGGGNITRLGIGSYNGMSETSAKCPVGMKIYKVALFDTNLSDAEIRAFDMTMPTMISNVDKGLSGDSNAAANLEKLRMVPQADLPEGTSVRIKSLAIGKRSNSADIPSYLVLNGYKSGTAVNTTVNGVAMSRWDFAGEVVLTMGQEYELKGYNASGVETKCGFGLYTNCTDESYKAVWCDWFKSPNVGKDYAPRYAIEVEVADTPMPRGWTKFDGNFDNFGSVSLGWKDTAVSFEAAPKGKAAYTGTTTKYPYYDNMDWGNATSFTLVGSFKVAVADGQTAPSGLFGLGWQNDGFMLAATAHKVSLVWTGSHVTGTSPIESETLDVDLTAGYHSYAVVADDAASTVKVYVDGEEVISCEETTISLVSSNWTNNNQKRGGIFSLPGGEMAGAKRNTDTRCDDYRIFGVPLSENQITAIANEHKLADNLIWLPVGDSITEGEQYMGHADQGDVDTRGGYRYQLWKAMEEAGQPTVTVGYRTGHSGTTEPDDCRWARHAAQYGGVIMHDGGGTHGAAGLNVETTLEVAGYPDVITVLIGVNDCSMTDYSEDQIGGVFQSWVNMIEKLSALRPKSFIFVSTLLPSGKGRATYIDKFNALVRAAAESNASPFNLANVTFADMHKEAFNDEFTASYFKAADALHPNETGAVILANAFAEHLKSAVAARAQNAAELVSVDNGTAGYVTVRFNKALKSVTSATLTITGTNVADEKVTLTLENGTIDETNKRLLKFATSAELKGGTYTATITNLAGSDGNGLALPASLSITDSKFVEILGSGAASNVPASLLNGFVKHGTLAMSDGTVSDAGIGSGDNFADNGPGEQFTTDNALPEYVKRVAYYMELKRPGQPAQFVWASMDATTGFGSKSAKIGIPTTTSGNVKALVGNLQVYGNRGNFTNSEIEDGYSYDVGIVEFTPWDWSAADQAGFPKDFGANKFGWNDTLNSTTLKGGMQIAKVLRMDGTDDYTKPGAEMLFAYNNFNRANTTDIGIGSFTSHRNNAGGGCTTVYDWTDLVAGTGMKAFAANAYEVKKLEIWTEEGEAPQPLNIPEGTTVTKSASDPLTVPVTGAGRLILENYLPTDSSVLESLQNSETWTGTVEIKSLNYTDNAGIIYFQNYANANSTVALNGVTATMYTGNNGHNDQTFGTLEIMVGGWATGAAGYTVDPLYNCNLSGSGTITINHSTKSGTVNFCGDHSAFTGKISFAANADKGVVLAPAGTGRTSGVSARQVMIHANTTTALTGSTNGTIIGTGTLLYVGVVPTDSALLNSFVNAEVWHGTVVIKNYTTGNTYAVVGKYANATSNLTLDNVKCYIFTNGTTSYPNLSCNNLTIGEGGINPVGRFSGAKVKLGCNKLLGSGNILITTDQNNNPAYFCIIGNASEFSGTIDSDYSTAAQIVFATTEAQVNGLVNGDFAARSVRVMEGATVSLGGTTSIGRLTGGVFVSGTLNTTGTISMNTNGIQGTLKLCSADASVTTMENSHIDSTIVTKRVVITDATEGRKTYSLETITPEPPTPTEGGITPSIPGADTIEIVDATGTAVTGGKIPLTTGVYTVTGKVGDTVVGTQNIGVVAAKDAETTTDRVTTAVAVPFKGATVANLLNTALLDEGDVVMAWINGAYEAWMLQADKTWKQQPITRAGGENSEGIDPATTELKRGQAVWVTTAGQIVTFGDTAAQGADVEIGKGHNLLGSIAYTAAEPSAIDTDQVQLIGEVDAEGNEIITRYNKTSTGWQSKIQTRTLLPNGKWVTTEETSDEAPTVKPGRGYWLIRK